MPNREHAIAIGLLLTVVVAGSTLRLYDLGQEPFRPDELLHHFVGQSLKAGEGPVLPSGWRYDRGIDFSRLVALTQQQVEEAHIAARLPSALMGVLGLVLLGGVAWAVAGPWTAVGATFLLAFYPNAVYLSRMARFYTLQMAVGLLALLTGWWAVRAMSEIKQSRSAFTRAWIWSVVTVALFLLATRIQVVTMSVMAGWGVCVLGLGVRDLRRDGAKAWKSSPALQLLLLGLFATSGFVVFNSALVNDLILTATTAPFWARNSAGVLRQADQYLEILIRGIPVVMAVAPLAYLGVFHRDRLLGWYLASWFAVPLLIHSLLPFSEERFIFLSLPALFLAVGAGAAYGGRLLFKELFHAFSRRQAGGRAAVTATAWLVLVGLAFAGSAAEPAVRLAKDEIIYEPRSEPGWARAAQLLDSRPDLQDLPLGSFRSLHALFYAGRVDFTTHVGRLETWEEGGWVARPIGSTDNYSGAPILTTPGRIRDYFVHAQAVLVLIEPHRLTGSRTDPALARALIEDAEELCLGRCGTVSLYRLELR